MAVDDGLPPERRAARAAFEAVVGTRIAADVVPVRASTPAGKCHVVNSLPWFAATEGVAVHDRGGSREGRRES